MRFRVTTHQKHTLIEVTNKRGAFPSAIQRFVLKNKLMPPAECVVYIVTMSGGDGMAYIVFVGDIVYENAQKKIIQK